MPDYVRPSVEDALASWAARVRANREQVEAYRELPDGPDFYAPIATNFRADPFRTDDPQLTIVQSLLEPTDVVLDIGGGGGRFALPMALKTRRVIVIEPSEGMGAVLRESAAAHGLSNIDLVPSRWPMSAPPEGDVAFISQVGYDIEQIGPFLDAMERAARRLCLALLFYRPAPFAFDRLWPEVHEARRASLPALPEFLTLLNARGTPYEVSLLYLDPPSYDSFDTVLALGRRQTWVAPGSAKDQRLAAAIRRRLVERNGRFRLLDEQLTLGVVSWRPRKELTNA